jgi:tetratricopeptide (TPR) repeat protein
MGVVHRARHRETGELVALKTVVVQRAEAFAALRREITALMRMDHPGVVRVIAEGLSAGRPWYAMEMLVGETLEDAMLRPRSLAQTLTLAARIASVLDHVHQAGVVHRDLKPSNVFLRDTEAPVLTDFGLAARFDGGHAREVLDTGGGAVGTPLYIAPEQIQGALTDARADLYSLGCILYEMLTGVPPFEGDGVGVIGAHLYAAPVPPSRRSADVTADLDDLVLGLLQKSPRDRIAYAGDVVAELRRLGAEVPAAPASSYLYRPEVAGRAGSLAWVHDRVKALRSSAGGRVFVTGESGVGKTRLVLEVVQQARNSGVSVIECTCAGAPLASGGFSSSPLLHGFRTVLLEVADLCRQGGPDEAARLLGPHAALLASYEPALRDLPGVRYDAPVPLDADAAMRRIQSAMGLTLRALAARRPLLLILDDLQWADALTLAVLDALDAELASFGRVMVLGAYRASEAPALLARIAGEASSSVLALDHLDADAVRAMVADMLATDDPPAELVGFLVAESEGNAFFVVEYLRAAVEAGLLRRTPGRGWTFNTSRDRGSLVQGALGVPKPLRKVLEGRVKRLGDAERRVLAMAAVLGRELAFDVLGRMADADDVEGALQPLYARQIVEPHGVAGARFSHDKLREHVYGELSGDDRRDLHRRAAAALEASLSEASLALRSADLADHWERAGDPSRALEYLVRAGEGSLAGGASADAAARLGRARSIAALCEGEVPRGVLAHIERLLGEARLHLGDIPGMMEACGAAFATLSRPGEPDADEGGGAPFAAQLAGLALGEALRMRGLRAARPARGAQRAQIVDATRAAARLSEGYFFQQEPARAVWAALAAARAAARLGPSGELARAHATLAVVCSFIPLRALSEEYLASAGAAAARSADPIAASVVEVYGGLIALGNGSLDHAAERLARGEGIARAHHDHRRAREAMALLGNVDYWRGAPRASLLRYEALAEASRAGGDDQSHAWALSGIAGCWMMLGRDAEAVALFRDAAVLKSERLARSEPLAHGNIAEAYLHLGRVDEALAWADAHYTRFRHDAPTGFQGIYGWSGTFDAFAAGCARAARGGNAWRRRFAQAADCARQVAWHARLFPVGRAAAARCAGVLLRLTGATSLAEAAFARSRAEAVAVGARAEEARACAELLTVCAPGPRREAARVRAREIFGEFGDCHWHREVTRAERGA